MVSAAEVRNVLDKVVHPSFGISIVALNMIRAIEVNDIGIQVEMVMNCPGCPAGKATLAHAHRVLRSLLISDEQEVTVHLLPEVWHAPWEFGG